MKKLNQLLKLLTALALLTLLVLRSSADPYPMFRSETQSPTPEINKDYVYAQVNEFRNLKGYVAYISPFVCDGGPCSLSNNGGNSDNGGSGSNGFFQTCEGPDCQGPNPYEWRQTVTQMAIDGQTVFSNSIDFIQFEKGTYSKNSAHSAHQNGSIRRGTPHIERLNYRAGEIQSRASDLSSPQYSYHIPDIPENSELMNQVLPTVAVGIMNGLENMKRSAALSNELYLALHRTQNQNLKLIAEQRVQQQKNQAQEQQWITDSVIHSGQTMNLVAPEKMGKTAIEIHKKLREYERLKKDFLAVRQYSMTNQARAETVNELVDAVFDGELRKATELAEGLLNQRDPIALLEDANRISQSFRNGIINLQWATKGEQAGLLDSYSPQTAIGTPSGQLIRRLANESQLAWHENQGFQYASEAEKAQFLAGNLLLTRADDQFKTNQNLAYNSIELAHRILLKHIGKQAVGISLSLKDEFKKLPEYMVKAYNLSVKAVNNPDHAVEKGTELAYDFIVSLPEIPRQFLIALRKGIVDYYNTDEINQGRMMGRLGLNIATNVIIGSLTPGAGPSLAANKITQAAGQFETQSAVAIKGLINKEALAASLARHSHSLIEATTQLSHYQIEGIKNLIEKSPVSADFALKLMGIGEASAAEAAVNPLGDFIGKLVTSNHPRLAEPGFLADVQIKYIKVDEALSKVPKAKLNEDVWRGVTREYKKNGKITKLTENDVFHIPIENKTSPHRISIGGPEGEMVMYTTAGDPALAKQTIMKEMKLEIPDGIRDRQKYFDENTWVRSMRVNTDRALDLTDTEMMKRVGLDQYVENAFKSEDSYLEAQIIGNIARQRGFDVVKMPSQYKLSPNIGILK